MNRHQFFYEGRFFGEVQNPVWTRSCAWLCTACGRTFALRLVTSTEPEPHPGANRWDFEKSLCEKCFSKFHPSEYLHCLAQFDLACDARDQLPVMRAQFIYNSTLFEVQHASSKG